MGHLYKSEFNQKFQNTLHYMKSSKTKIDIDFLVDEENIAIQACYSMANTDTASREIGQLKN